MSAIATAKRRRRQAKMNNAHVHKLGRRVYGYGNKSAEKSSRRLAEMIRRRQEIIARGGKVK